MVVLLFFLIVLLPGLSNGATFYVDPIHGLDSNDGSYSSPWKSLQYLFDNNKIESWEWDSLPYSPASYLVQKNSGAQVKGGDIIYLREGNHGDLSIISYYNESPITLAAAQGSNPVLRNILVQSSSNWILTGLKVNASAYPSASFSTLVSLENHSWRGPVHSIDVRGCSLSSILDSSSWTRDDWNNLAKNGMRVDGTNMTIYGNDIININFGISVGATHSLVERNRITNFAGDGMRGLGDYTVFQYNTIKNAYDVNDNHDDGFQSWSRGADGKVGTGTVTGIVLRGNTIINYEDFNQPFRGTLQGIGCFDGMFKDWVVEGNRVEVDHWHGISLYGSINGLIRDNVVVDLNNDRPGPPWIRIDKHKDGTLSHDNLITCNISPRITVVEGINNRVEHNTLSEVGSPRHPLCNTMKNMMSFLSILLQSGR